MLALNLRRDFPSQWARFLTPVNPADGNVFEFDVSLGLFPVRDAGKTLKVNTIWLLARCGDPRPYIATLTPPLPPGAATTMEIVRSQDYGGLHVVEQDVSGNQVEIDPTQPPSRWVLRVTPSVPATQEMAVDDMLLVLGYQWK
jgi:hypothetical protein